MGERFERTWLVALDEVPDVFVAVGGVGEGIGGVECVEQHSEVRAREPRVESEADLLDG